MRILFGRKIKEVESGQLPEKDFTSESSIREDWVWKRRGKGKREKRKEGEKEIRKLSIYMFPGSTLYRVTARQR